MLVRSTALAAAVAATLLCSSAFAAEVPPEQLLKNAEAEQKAYLATVEQLVDIDTGTDQAATQARVWKGQAKHVSLGSRQPIVVAVPAGQSQNITTAAIVQGAKIIATVAAEQPLGEFRASLGGQPIASVPLVALQAVPEAGFFGRLWDAFLMLFVK